MSPPRKIVGPPDGRLPNVAKTVEIEEKIDKDPIEDESENVKKPISYWLHKHPIKKNTIRTTHSSSSPKESNVVL